MQVTAEEEDESTKQETAIENEFPAGKNVSASKPEPDMADESDFSNSSEEEPKAE